MDLYDITILQRDPNQGNLYDLIETTFVLKSVAPLQIIVLPEQEMRLDLVSHSIYGNTDYLDLLMNLNNIDNPLNIMAGDTILYISLNLTDYYRQSPNKNSQQRNILLNVNKSTKTDYNRQDYLNNNYQLPPTFLKTPASPIVVSNGNITIKPIL
jgi:hypothetical protein